MVSLTDEQGNQIEDVKGRLAGNGKPVTPGRVVAGMNFGFWIEFTSKNHAASGLNAIILKKGFPSAPKNQLTQKKMNRRWQTIRQLRNKVFHHERIIYWQDLDKKFNQLIEATMWISPEMAELALALNRFKTIHSEGLPPWIEKIRKHWPNRPEHFQ